MAYYNYPTYPYMPQTPTQPTPPSNSLVWVQGESGAKSYIIPPNTTALLMDSESQRFYIKSADSTGMPMPLRVFEYKEVTGAEAAPVDKYVTREEFDKRLAELKEVKDE